MVKFSLANLELGLWEKYVLYACPHKIYKKDLILKFKTIYVGIAIAVYE